MKKITFILIIFLFVINPLTAQRGVQKDRSFYYSYGEKFFAEAHALPYHSIDSMKVIVLFKIMYEALSFSQADFPDGTQKYSAAASVEIEFKDPEGIIRRRAFWRDSVFAGTYDKTNSKTDYFYGFKDISLPSGKLSLKAILYSQKGKKISEKKLAFTSDNQFLKKPSISQPFFASAIDRENVVIPYVLGDNIAFTSKNSKILLSVSYNIYDKKDYYYMINKITSEEKVIYWNNTVNLSGKADFMKNTVFEIDPQSTNSRIYVKINHDFIYPDNRFSNIKIGLLEIGIPAENLVPGKYLLKVFCPGAKDTLQQEFKVEWYDMPLSLKNNIEYAVWALYYILSDEEYDRINSGSDREIFEKILAFWKDKDPTPHTPYNEAMAEYYRRVDYAYFNFQTISRKDGAMTERGKIYILYGAPDKVDYNLKDNKTIEKWWYEKLKKEFIFESISSGVYKLVKINEI